MKKHTKVLLTLLCAVLLVVGSVMGTLAYLTSDDSVTNTFTVGNIEITLDETDVNDEGVKDGDTRVEANDYHLLPGHTYIKDPIVHVADKSEESYVRMLVTVNNLGALKEALPDEEYYQGDIFLLQKLVTGWEQSNWEVANVTGNVYEFRYVGTEYAGSKTGTVKEAADGAFDLPALFTHIVMPGEIDNAHLAKLEGLTITVVAEAIQADGFGTADEAWAAFDAQ